MELEGKVALITGAAVRIGRAIALSLAGRGVRIVVHYNGSVSEAKETAERVIGLGAQAVTAQANLRDSGSPRRLLAQGVAAFGQVDILINSAAIFRRGTLADTTESNWDDHLAINLKAPFFLSQAYVRHLQEGQQGHIINIVDWRVIRPGTAYMAYTLAKAGLLTMTKSLALALGPQVQVNAIAPGAIIPPPGDESGYFERLAERIPARRTGAPEDIARAVSFLLDSDFVTGETIFVTGGEHL